MFLNRPEGTSLQPIKLSRKGALRYECGINKQNQKEEEQEGKDGRIRVLVYLKSGPGNVWVLHDEVEVELVALQIKLNSIGLKLVHGGFLENLANLQGHVGQDVGKWKSPIVLKC